ncbi:anthranilate phosphoribosyltransferase [Jeotgalicoccus psychrophilus]|uniref:anthranilate phosphoribosyltransferase n=1 Tax=Jeotgalicoccus psychrophilus TaxID=157228 RepID=UPI000405A163|nr:anthranilate phosphoribosyltransferase [Jeotgalicoccus psychrophilus]
MTLNIAAVTEKTMIKVKDGSDLSYKEMHEFFTEVLDGKVTDDELRDFIIALSDKGETVDEITAIAEVLKSYAKDIPNVNNKVMDNCGTGGDRSRSFNISTTSAFVLGSCGVTVAKHGNKSVTSKTGSSDVLQALGVNLNFDADRVAKELNESNITFLSAPHVHPKMGQIMRVRQTLKRPTVFNFIGPCISPLDLDYQFLGIYDRKKLMTITKVLQRLGRKNAVVMNGAGHMDEATLLGENHLVFLRGGEIEEVVIDPTDYGLTLCDKSDIAGGDGYENKEILESVLKGTATRAQIETVLLNAGIGLFVADEAKSIGAGIQKAREAIQSGKAYNKLQEVIKNNEESKV